MNDKHLVVTEQESGQKLLRFLARHLHDALVMSGTGAAIQQPRTISTTDLHRWIRTGQVRVNKGRVKAFHLLQAGDIVRIPPFIQQGRIKGLITKPSTPLDLPIVLENAAFMLVNKPAGLATQPGTGQSDSVVQHLASCYHDAPLLPAPVHRLDKETSGLLLIGKTHQALRIFSNLFAQATAYKDTAQDASPFVHKEYLAWVQGRWPHTHSHYLQDRMRKEAIKGYELMKCTAQHGAAALSKVSLLEQRETEAGTASLLRLHLITGRTHQLRVQLASRGFPVVGDTKYGEKKSQMPSPSLLLHAFCLQVRLTGSDATLLFGTAETSQFSVQCLPSWAAPFTVEGIVL